MEVTEVHDRLRPEGKRHIEKESDIAAKELVFFFLFFFHTEIINASWI